MSAILCLGAPAMALALARLETPGVLVGRARSKQYRQRMAVFASWVIQTHGLATYQHDFPLVRPGLSRILGCTASAVQRLIATAEAIGLLVQRSSPQRRCEAKVPSPTQGSTGAWWMPDRWDIGPAFLALLPQRQIFDWDAPHEPEDGTRLAFAPLENEFDQEEPTNVRDRISTRESISFGDRNGAIFTDRIKGDLPLSGFDDPIDDALEDAIERFRPPGAMPDRKPCGEPVETDEEFQARLMRIGSEPVQPSSLLTQSTAWKRMERGR